MTNIETPTKTCISEYINLFLLKFPGISYKPNISLNVNFRLKPIIIQKGVFVRNRRYIYIYIYIYTYLYIVYIYIYTIYL